MRTNRFFVFLVVLLAIGRQAAAAPEQWVEVRSTHFTVDTDAGEKQARKLLDEFERMRWVFHTLYPRAAVDPAVPIVVIAARNRTSFTRFLPAERLGKNEMQLDGYFSESTDRNYILLCPDSGQEHPFATVYHEYTHVLFASAQEWLPIWFNEGMAEFFQNTDIEGKDVRLGQPSVDDILYLRQQRLIPLEVLFRVDDKSPYYHQEEKGSVFYAESWALIHYLTVTDRENHTNKLQQYLVLVSQHQDPVDAAAKAFGDLRGLQSNLQGYIQHGDYMQFVLNSAAAPVDESAFKLQTMTQTQADALRADVLVNVNRLQDAQALLDAVLKADPNNVQAQEAMGMLAFRQGNMEEARKWFGNAVKLGSQDFLAYFNYANLSTGQADEDASVESSLRTAIKLNPQFALSYDRLAVYYGMKHEKLDEAHMLNLQAIGLEPGNVAFRINTANILMEMERYDDAENVLKAAAVLARKPADKERVQTRIDQLEQFKAAGARGGVIVSEEQEKTDSVVSQDKGGVVDVVMNHPSVEAKGPLHAFEGVIGHVTCTAPHQIEFRVEGSTGQSKSFYNNDFTTIDLTAAAGVSTGDNNMFPCTDFEGRKARVQYVDSPDKTVDGQATAIELRK